MRYSTGEASLAAEGLVGPAQVDDITDLRSFPLSPLRTPKPPSLRGPDSGTGTQNFFHFPPKFPRDPASLPSSGISEGVRRLSGRVDGKECPLQSIKEFR